MIDCITKYLDLSTDLFRKMSVVVLLAGAIVGESVDLLDTLK